MFGFEEYYGILKSVIEFPSSPLPVESRLEGMVQAIAKSLHPDRCLLLGPEKIPREGVLSRIAQEKKPLWVEEGAPVEGAGVVSEEKDLPCASFACIPLHDETVLQGILYVGFLKKRRFSPLEKDLLLFIAREMESTIRNDRLLRKAEQTLSEETALHEMEKGFSSNLRLEDLLKLIVTTGTKILHARGGVLRIEDRKSGKLKLQSSIGDYDHHPFDERMAKRVFFSRTSLSLSRSGKRKLFLSMLCVPLLSRGKSFGTLAFYDKKAEPSKFGQRDLEWLLTMATQVSCVIENAMIHSEISLMVKEHERRVRQLSILWELSKVLLTTINLERIMHITLTAITIGEGLGFNRAMLFRVDEKTRFLEGTLAIGPNTAEEAGRIWSSLSKRRGNASDAISQIESSGERDSGLNSLVKGLQIPLEHEQCILTRTVLEGRSFNIRLSQAEEGWVQSRCERGCQLSSEMGCYVSEHLSQDPQVYAFATVPLWGKGKVIGVILVDNLYNQNPITEEDVQYLTMFCNQAGLAIENAMLYKKLGEVHQELKEAQTGLVHQEKMAALGELCDSIAHEIKNPLVSIGGFARRLYRNTPDEAPEKRFSQIIMVEVGRLEKILDDFYRFTRNESSPFKECDIREIIQHSLAMVSERLEEEKVDVTEQYAEDLPTIKGDYHQLKQAFFNMITNSFQAMKGQGKLSINVYPVSMDHSDHVRVELVDTGFGIDPENLHNIFNPFYSTKESRLGLGLPMVHKIVSSHRGQIEVFNSPGEGVTFIVTLPAQTERMKISNGL